MRQNVKLAVTIIAQRHWLSVSDGSKIMLQKEMQRQRSLNVKAHQFLFLQIFSKGIVNPSNLFSCKSIHNIPKEIKDKFKDLKEVAEGDSKPERKATTQGIEQTPILWQIDFI